MIGRSLQRRAGKPLTGILIVVIGVAAAFGVDYASHGALRTVARNAGMTLYGTGDAAVAAVADTGFFTSNASLQAQVQKLTTALAAAQEKAAAYDVLVAQNAALSKLTHLATSTHGVTASIDTSLSASPYGTFGIGAGSADGIAKDDVVLSAQGFVIGTVTDVSTHTALVSELFAPARQVPTTIHGASVTVEGHGGLNARAKVPRGIPVATGDVVFVPGFNQRAAGIVGAVASSSGSAYSDVDIVLPVNLSELTYVYVVPHP